MPVAKKRKPEEKRAFLEDLATGMHVLDAVARTSQGSNWWYKWRNSDDAFAEEWDAAAKKGSKTRLSALEAEADRRAREGYDVITKEQVKSEDGKTTGRQMVKSVRHYSDTLLIFRIKAEAQRSGDDSYEDRQKTQVEQEVKYVIGSDMSEEDAADTKEDWSSKFKPPVNGAGRANGHS